MRYLTFILLLILTSCENDQTVSVSHSVMEVAESFSERFGAEDYLIEQATDSDNRFLDNSVKVTFKNCSNVNISESGITSLQDSVANSLILSFDSRRSLPDYLMISFYEGYDYYIASKRNTINQTYGREYILSHYDSHQTYFDIEKKIGEFLQKNKIGEAKTYCDSIIASGENIEIPLQYRGYFYYMNSDTLSAIDDFKHAVRANSDNELNYWNLSLIYGEQNDYHTAIQYIDTCLMKLPNQPRAMYYKGYYLFKSGSIEEGCEQMNIAKTLGFQVDNETPLAQCK